MSGWLVGTWLKYTSFNIIITTLDLGFAWVEKEERKDSRNFNRVSVKLFLKINFNTFFFKKKKIFFYIIYFERTLIF